MKRLFGHTVMIALASWLLAGVLGGRTLWAQEASKPIPPVSGAYFSQIFTEKVLTVSREVDGILPGTLRTVLIQASGIRSQNSFELVRIVFEPTVKRIRVTKGPLPEIDGSLTTLDCQTSAGRVLIEGAIESTEGQDPSQESAGLKLTSNGNTVRNCHITGFKGPGILIQGNRNLVEYNTLGYHKDSAETAVDSSSLYAEPKTNQGSGILINGGSNENTVQNNEIVANTSNGIQISQAAGTGNTITFNIFSKNSGKPIKVLDSPFNTLKPQITKISKQGDIYVIEGICEANAEIQLYLSGKDENEVGMNILQGMRSTGENFTLATKSKGFVPNQTRLMALSQGLSRNTSEFSSPILIPLPGAPTLLHDPELEKPKLDLAPKEELKKPATGETGEDHNNEEVEGLEVEPSDKGSEPAKTNSPSVNNNILSSAKAETASETTLNIKGMGDKGGEPDSGSSNPKQHEVSALGI